MIGARPRLPGVARWGPVALWEKKEIYNHLGSFALWWLIAKGLPDGSWRLLSYSRRLT